MESTSGGAKRRPLFSSDRRLELMEQVVGQPTGAIVTLGGQEIDLVAIPFSKDRKISDEAVAIGTLFDDMQRGKVTDFAAMAPSVVEHYGAIKDLLKDVVHDSIEIGEGGEAVFDDWFEALPMIPTIQVLLKATFQANGLGDLGNVIAAARAAAPAAPTPSTTEVSSLSQTQPS